MSTGKPLGWENWNAGEPNNYEYEGGEREHCLELWNRDGKVRSLISFLSKLIHLCFRD